MDDTELNLRLRVRSLNGFWKTLQTIHTGNQDVLHASILQFGQDREPELGPLCLCCPHAKHILDTFHGNSDGKINSLGNNLSIVLDLDPDGIQIDDWIDVIQGGFCQSLISSVTASVTCGPVAKLNVLPIAHFLPRWEAIVNVVRLTSPFICTALKKVY